MQDELDELIEADSIKENPEGTPPANPEGNPGGEPGGEKQTPPAATNQPVIESQNQPAKPTPKELGFETEENWDSIKQKLSDVDNLRRKVEQAESLPKTVFANQEVAGYNEFLKKNPQIKSFGFYESLTSLTPDDPIQVLTKKWILDNPEYVGKEELVSKMIANDYKVNPELFTPEEVEMNTIKLNRAGKDAFTEIDGLRRSFASQTVETPENIAESESEWNSAISEELTSYDKLPIPILNAQTGKPELYLDFEIPKEMRDAYQAEAAKVFAKIGKASPETRQHVKSGFVKEFLFNNFAKITHAIKTKAAADERAAVEAEYDGAGGLRSERKDASAAAGGEDVYDQVFGPLH